MTGDAESTDASESIAWTSDKALSLIPNSANSPVGNACDSTAPSYNTQYLTGVGTTTVQCGPSPVSADHTGTVMLQATAPTKLTVTLVGGGLAGHVPRGAPAVRHLPGHSPDQEPGPLASRVAQWRSELGDSLVEVLLAIVVVSIGALAIMAAFATAITGTTAHRNFTTFDTMLRTASSEVSSLIAQQPASNFANCSGAYQYATAGSIPLTGSYSARVTSVAYWNGNGFTTPQAPAQSCPTGALPNSPQQLTVSVSYKGTTSSITTVVDDPVTPSGSGSTCQYPASQLVWVQQPSTTPAGASLFPVPTVAVEDKTGCIVQNDASQVSLTITAGTGGAGATLNNCVPSLNYGSTVFSGCSIGVPASGYTLTASDPTDGLTAVQSAPFTVTPGVPADPGLQAAAGRWHRRDPVEHRQPAHGLDRGLAGQSGHDRPERREPRHRHEPGQRDPLGLLDGERRQRRGHLLGLHASTRWAPDTP